MFVAKDLKDFAGGLRKLADTARASLAMYRRKDDKVRQEGMALAYENLAAMIDTGDLHIGHAVLLRSEVDSDSIVGTVVWAYASSPAVQMACNQRVLVKEVNPRRHEIIGVLCGTGNTVVLKPRDIVGIELYRSNEQSWTLRFKDTTMWAGHGERDRADETPDTVERNHARWPVKDQAEPGNLP